MKIIFTLLFIALIYSGASAQWQQTNGPAGGYTSHLRKVSDYLFVNANAGGIFRSADDGVTWSSVNNGLPTYPHCYYLTSYENKLYAAIYNSGVYFSEDFGETWSPINEGIETLTAYALAVSSNDIYVGAANGGFYSSSDHGSSWALHEGALKGLGVRDFVIAGDKVFAAVNGTPDKAGVYLSEDKGATWTKLGLAVTSINAMAGYDNAIYVAGPTFMISRDYGVTWSAAAIGGGAGYFMSAIHAVGDEVNIGGSAKAVFYSEDEGQTWVSKVGSAPDNQHTSIFSEGMKFWLATAEGVSYSGDGGGTWEERNNGLHGQIVDYLKVDGDTLMAVTDRSGLFTSWDQGNSWIHATIGTPDFGVNRVTGLHMAKAFKVAGTFDGIFRTSSLSGDWIQMLPAGEEKAISTLSGEGDSIIAAVYEQGVYTSINGGQDWVFKPTDIFGQQGLMCSAVKGDTIVIGGSEGIFVSRDFGTTWQTANLPPAFFFPYAVLFDETSLVFVTSQGIFKSLNLGGSWSAIDDFPADVRPEDMVISADGTYYAATSEGVYTSYDKGLKWFAVNKDLISPTTSLAIIGNQLFAGTYGRSVWVSAIDQLNAKPAVAQQATEFNITSEEEVAFTPGDFQISDPDNDSFTLVIREGANYTVAGNVITPVPGFVGDLIVPVQVHDGFQLSDEFNATVRVVRIVVSTTESAGSLKVYPNPVAETIFIEGANAPELRIVLMDHFGKVIREQAASGADSYAMDLSSLSAGLYLLKIQTNTGSRMVRFLKE